MTTIVRRFLLLSLLCFHVCVFAFDADVIVAGSGPISLIEALYQHHLGHTVLVIERDKKCGGVWSYGTVCGVPHVDLACHDIGQDQRLIKFFEKNVGCRMVSLDEEDAKLPLNVLKRVYFSGGCYELISNLLQMMRCAGVPISNNEEILNVSVDSTGVVHAKTSRRNLSAKRIIFPRHFSVIVDNYPMEKVNRQLIRFYHLYLLIQDSASQRFSVPRKMIEGVNRMVNLTNMTSLKGTDKQLIAMQVSKEASPGDGGLLLEKLKEAGLVSQAAWLLKEEKYVYEQCSFSQQLTRLAKDFPHSVTVLSSTDLHNLSAFLPQWEKVIIPPCSVSIFGN